MVGRECFLTKPQSRQEILAPLSMRVWVSMAFKVCDGLMSWIGICIDGVVFTWIAAHFTFIVVDWFKSR